MGCFLRLVIGRIIANQQSAFFLLVGADIIGLNCKFDPYISLETLHVMKEALEREGLSCHLMIQPVGYHTPDSGRTGFQSLPECPFGKRYLTW